ncbi:30S ribosomal protein S15 [Methanosarcinales archaeon ex4572_44]|nr:MAG: 30S ribosomal protein S15 [Methanosarcinales archaeon ex4572_44]
MAKMHTRRKGVSGPTHPVKSNSPEWCSLDTDDLSGIVVDLAKQGRSSSAIGMILRDTYGVADSRLITGKRITDVMEENGVGSKVPEDLHNLIVKALRLKKHLNSNTKDVHNKRQLTLVESKIRRMVRYYKSVGKIPSDWKYSLKAAELLITR